MRISQSLRPGSRYQIEGSYPALNEQIQTIDSQFKISESERAQLIRSTADALIWKGFEIGAIAEKSGNIKLRLIEIEQELPDAKVEARNALLKEKSELEQLAYVLDVEVDARLSEQPIFAMLALPSKKVPSAGPLFARLRLYHNVQPTDRLSPKSRAFVALQEEVQRHVISSAHDLSAQTVSFIDSLFDYQDGALAPLAAVRLEALENTRMVLNDLTSSGEMKANQPTYDEFAKANEAVEKEFGFDSGKYDAYTGHDLLNVVASGLVAAELVKMAAHLKLVQGAVAVLERAALQAAEKAAAQSIARGFLARAATGLVARGAAIGGKFLGGPVVWVGTSLPLVYDGVKWADRKMYRSFLKAYIPQAFSAGLAGYKYAQFSADVDDRIVDVIGIAEAVTTLVMASRFRTFFWGAKLGQISSVSKSGYQMMARWARWKSVYEKTHVQTLMAMLGSAASATGAATSALLRSRLALLSPKAFLKLLRANASHIAFIGGSITMAAEVHFVSENYGHFGVNAWKNSDSFIGFTKLLWQQLGEVWGDSPQAQIDLLSIGLSDTVLTYGSVNPNLSVVGLGHLYGWVSAASDLAGQVALDQTMATEGERPSVSESVEKIDWLRALIHYSFVSTFSTYKQLYAYMPVLNRVLQPLVIKTVARPFLRTMVRSYQSGILPRRLALTLARAEKGSALWTSRYMLSLGSNFIGNKGFIDIAMVLKKNSSNVPSQVDEAVRAKAKEAFAQAGISWTPEEIHQMAVAMKSTADELKQIKTQIIAEHSAQLQAP